MINRAFKHTKFLGFYFSFFKSFVFVIHLFISPKNMKDWKSSVLPSLQPLKAVSVLISLFIHNILFLHKVDIFWFAYCDLLWKYLGEPPDQYVCSLGLYSFAFCDCAVVNREYTGGPVSHRVPLAVWRLLWSPVHTDWPLSRCILLQFWTHFSCLPFQGGISLTLDGVIYLLLFFFFFLL